MVTTMKINTTKTIAIPLWQEDINDITTRLQHSDYQDFPKYS